MVLINVVVRYLKLLAQTMIIYAKFPCDIWTALITTRNTGPNVSAFVVFLGEIIICTGRYDKPVITQSIFFSTDIN